MDEMALLHHGVRVLDGPVFAVLDGARFADLPDTLLRAGLTARPLYIDRGDNHPERLSTAPRMVGPLGGEELEAVLRVVSQAGPAAAVFWHGADADALYRHLRGLNMVRIPRAPVPDAGQAEDPHETVLFRHADANVMAQVSPALGAAQMARLLGPANALFFLPDPDWREPAARTHLRILRKDPDWPRAPTGMLRLGAGEVALVESGRAAVSRLRRARYLRATCREETAGADDETVARHILLSERTGRELGLVSEGAHCRWAFILCKTDGRVLHSREALDFIARGERSPDRQVKRFMLDAADWLRARSAARVPA